MCLRIPSKTIAKSILKVTQTMKDNYQIKNYLKNNLSMYNDNELVILIIPAKIEVKYTVLPIFKFAPSKVWNAEVSFGLRLLTQQFES